MRFVIDLMAVTGFLLSASMTAGLVISYSQMDEIMRKTLERVTANVEQKLEDKLDQAMPKLPSGTAGPSIF